MPVTAPPDLPFAPAAYSERRARVQAAMAGQGLDALVVADPANMAWLTGYDGWSFYVPQAVVVVAGAEAPVWWGREMDAAGALRTAWLPADRIRPYGDHLVHAADRHPCQHLAEVLADLGLGRARIGTEMDAHYWSARSHAVLGACLPEAEIVDAGPLVNWQRVVKSPAELALMRRAARIAEAVIDGALARARPGLRKNELAGEILRDGARGAGGQWGDYPAIVPMLPSGADAAAPHLTWNGAPLRAGEATFFEIAGVCRRYHVPFCRTVYLGTPPTAMRRAEAAVVEGIEAGLAAARAGNTAGDIARALQASLARAGISRTARCGYSVGLAYPPDWGERTVSLRPEDETVLRPGMVFHFMPGLWMDDWGLEITETILIRERGPAECLCDRPREMTVRPA